MKGQILEVNDDLLIHIGLELEDKSIYFKGVLWERSLPSERNMGCSPKLIMNAKKKVQECIYEIYKTNNSVSFIVIDRRASGVLELVIINDDDKKLLGDILFEKGYAKIPPNNWLDEDLIKI